MPRVVLYRHVSGRLADTRAYIKRLRPTRAGYIGTLQYANRANGLLTLLSLESRNMSRIESVPHGAGLASEVSGQIARHCVLTRTRQIARVLTALYDEALRPLGINASQLSLLVLIAEYGPLSRAALGRKNHHDRSTLTRNLQPLIAQGWVADGQPAGDGRSRALSITHIGHALLHTAGPAWSAAQARTANLLGAEGASALVSIAAGLPPSIV